MAKASSPVRLQSELMTSATAAGLKLHRSAAEQIEYWASLGRSVAKSVNPDTLLEVSAGLAELQVVPVKSVAVDPDSVFAAVERDRDSGKLAELVFGGNIRYQASIEHPGNLEKIDKDGSVLVGQFSQGKFVPMK